MKKTEQTQNTSQSVETTTCQKCGEIHSGNCKTNLITQKIRRKKLKLNDDIVGFNYFSSSVCFKSSSFITKCEDLMMEFALYMVENGFEEKDIEETIFPIFDIKFLITKEERLNFSNGEIHNLVFYQFVERDRIICFHIRKK